MRREAQCSAPDYGIRGGRSYNVVSRGRLFGLKVFMLKDDKRKWVVPARLFKERPRVRI